ncbi:hypothetical protein GDO81_029135 [Engystomops pustulosus]|uniref:Transposase n=1 Tax=Engystomops pustulosus TaxID=76066 RepID=A0AAV6YCE2_ENGPU|nr:hypothetical protein GDO81_029135 [Engystomops pustulosus]
MSEHLRIMRSKELLKKLKELWQGNWSGQSYKRISAALFNWKKFGTTTLPRPGCPVKLSNLGRKALVKEVEKNLRITVAELQRCGREMEASPQCKT